MTNTDGAYDQGDIDLQILADQATLYEKSLPAEELDAVYAGFTEEDYMAKAEHDREKYEDQADYTSTLDDDQFDHGGWEDR